MVRSGGRGALRGPQLHGAAVRLHLATVVFRAIWPARDWLGRRTDLRHASGGSPGNSAGRAPLESSGN